MEVYVLDRRNGPIVVQATLKYGAPMLRATRTRLYDFQALLWAAGFVLCSAHAAGALHEHDVGAPDEFCTACSLAHSEFTDEHTLPGADKQRWIRARAVPESSAYCGSHPFQAERSRAPPRHF